MTYKNNRMRIDFRHLKLPSLWEISIFILVLYAFFFQYSVMTINSAMLTLNFLCILFGIAHALAGALKERKTFYTWVMAFVFVSVFLSLIFGVSVSSSISIGIRMIEYCLTGLSVYLFSISRENRLKEVLFFVWLSVFLLAINVMFYGTAVKYLGAIGLGILNTNEMSSFFVLMVFCAFYLYGKTDNNLQRIIIWSSLLFVFYIQIQSASRRGFIVMVFMMVINIIYGVIPYRNQYNSKGRLFVYSTIIIIGAVAFVKTRDYILNNTILGERLVGAMTGGDAARTRYHIFALEQFKHHPIVGIGVGGINYLQGVYSHSLFYEVLACTGLVGALIIIIGFSKMVRELLRSLCRQYDHNGRRNLYLNKVLLIYAFSLFISGFAVVMIYDFYFYLSLALIAAGLELNKKQ